MLELLFIIGFFVMLLVTGISLLGILAAVIVATALMFVGGLFALVVKLLPWLLLAAAGDCGGVDYSCTESTKGGTLSSRRPLALLKVSGITT